MTMIFIPTHADSREDCAGADELVTQCTRNCMRKDDDDCLECVENCSGTYSCSNNSQTN